MTTLRAEPTGVRPPVSAAQARVAAVACLALLVPSPLQWLAVASTPGGVLRYAHVGAVVMLAVYGFGVGLLHGVVGRCALLLTLLGAVTTMGVVTAAAYGSSMGDPAQKAVYALVGIVFAAAAYTALSDDAGCRILVWAAPAAVSATVVCMVGNLLASTLDPVTELGTALRTGTSAPLVRLFSFGLPVRDELAGGGRHEVIAALVVTILVTVLAERACRRWVRIVAAVLCGLGLLVVVLSLSRAVLLAVAIPAVAVVVRVIVRSSRRRVVALAAAVAALLVVVWPLTRLLYTRTVDDTGSYSARLDGFDFGRDELLLRVLGGGPVPQATSTHTFPGDALLQAGWLAGLCALGIVAILAGHAVVAAGRFHADGSRLQLVALAAASLVLVRSMTSGSGYINQPGWLAFGLVVAIGLCARPEHGMRPDQEA